MNHTPISLLERLRCQPDAESWQRLVDLYQPWLRTWLQAHVLQTADVDDLVQEVMAVLVREIGQFRHNGRKGAFRTWLRGIVVNRLRDFWRQSQHRERIDPGALEARLEQLADEHSQLGRLWDRAHDQQVVAQLLKSIAADFGPKTWQAFRAFMLEGKKAAAVAAELDISQAAVWNAKSKVLKRLRQVAGNFLD